ncbi:hypothetical protein QS306_09605 [Paraburkholderia bonniea]|uniref:hypothetical protein n=1 Tax=Paraburkholderia bonniea TaxID=2152891 RepID=UPI0012910840|nr:hypothetical protein [Paraburkholderia bonniea]WJF89376.1 hypothetical protein QS306_09605 [Paraburkholderia bonniea]WJF92691.1 hypothetical protein QS308_09615 [Paraburkholderia bonniea]
MKSFVPAAIALAMTLACGGTVLAAQSAPVDPAPEPAEQSANERVGLPDLKTINRPAAEISSKVDINVPRTPSFHERSGNGTEITEYRDKGKPVEINVQSNFGTRYQMSTPADTSPAVRDNGRASTRLPSVNLRY